MILSALLLAASLAPPGADQLPSTGWPALPPGCRRGTFVENRGQWPEHIDYLARVEGAWVRVEGATVWLQIDSVAEASGRVVRLSFEGTSPQRKASGLDQREGHYGFFIGSDPEGWQGGVPGFGGVRIEDLYEGIDLVLRERNGKLKYDLLLDPGADSSLVRVRLDGAELHDASQLAAPELRAVLHVPGASWEAHPGGQRVARDCDWHQTESGGLSLSVPDWNRAFPLVIDPELTWSTYLGSAYAGGTGDGSTGIVNDPTGNVVALGLTEALDFPTTPGTYQNPPFAGNILFATKVRRSDGGLVYSNLFGGVTFTQRILAGVADAEGRAILGGEFMGTGNDFPTTSGALDTQRDALGYSGFVLRFSADGISLDYSTYLEDSVAESSTVVLGLDLMPNRQVVAVGATDGGSFPLTAGAYDVSYSGGNEGFVAILDEAGSSLVASTLIGGSESDAAEAVDVGSDGVITVAGRTASNDFSTTAGAFMTTVPSTSGVDFFVVRVQPDMQQVLWSTLIGGAYASEFGSVGGLGRTASGEIVFSGVSESADFPVTAGALSTAHPGNGVGVGFVSCFTASGNGLVYSTFIDTFGMSSIIVEPSGLVILGGGGPAGFLGTPGAHDLSYNGGGVDQGMVVLGPAGDRLLYASYLGGPNSDVGLGAAFSPPATITIAGDASWPGGYPTTVGALQPTYQGGQADSTLATLDMVLDGIELRGPSRPGCFENFIANATELPVAGAASFGLYGSGAPTYANGWLVIKALSPGAGAPPVGLWGPASLFLPVQSNRNGWVETKLPLTGVSAGRRFACQYLFRTPPSCTGAGPFDKSNVVIVTVQ